MIANPSRSLTKILFPLIVVTPLTGCTVLEPVGATREAILVKVGAGDRLELVTDSGEIFEVSVSELGDDAILVMDDDGRTRAIAYTELADVNLRRPAKGRTIGLALGMAAAVGAIQFSGGEDILTFPGAPTGL